ncbi:hypothetical protein [Streptacidiphilus carbonis]|uniref:hypothetical protein n=1 Tax=Streptacidiphilus carbonis TaxID=105422 RepID=UPI0005A6768D|nr:hypothetical protein [Streptacidiphilus carbonis]
MPQPSVGRIVHYVSYGTPGGEYSKECRAAVITEVSPESKGEGREIVSLAVLNPTGFFFNRGCEHHEVAVEPDPMPPQPGGGALNHPGGSWHWPEPDESPTSYSDGPALPCQDCGGGRECARCEGRGHLDGERCPACESLGVCATCRTDNA